MAAQREWYEKDYYKVLGVADDATPKEITKAYRKLARDSSPRHASRRRRRRGAVQGGQAAYDVLGDEAKRKEYDEVRRLGPIGRRVQAAAAAPGGFTFNVGDARAALGDLLGQMFGRGRPRSAPASRQSGRDAAPTSRRR